MKIQRYKRVRRILNFYKNNFHISHPYKIVADGTFLKAALDNKINLREQMSVYLGNQECQFFVTECVVRELQSLGAPLKGALSIAREYKSLKCKHPRLLTASQCLHNLAKKDKQEKYFFATQDQILTENLHRIPGKPLLFIKYNAILLEKPTEMSEATKNEQSEAKLNFEGVQKENLQNLLKKNDLLNDKTEIKKKRRKIKGPNPLSCKKKKIKFVPPLSESDAKKRKRKRIKNENSIKKAKFDT
uniref:rRNA-processing protein UTP23 homolog n=1 Tax=Romanomermis culicivorax TaxID=13658 RepID=A0A915IMA9_ROMCU